MTKICTRGKYKNNNKNKQKGELDASGSDTSTDQAAMLVRCYVRCDVGPAAYVQGLSTGDCRARHI